MTSFSSGFTAASIGVSLMVCQRRFTARRLTAPASVWLSNWIGLPNFVNCFSVCGDFTLNPCVWWRVWSSFHAKHELNQNFTSSARCLGGELFVSIAFNIPR